MDIKDTESIDGSVVDLSNESNTSFMSAVDSPVIVHQPKKYRRLVILDSDSDEENDSSVANTATSSKVTSDSSVTNTANSLNISGDSSVATTAILSNITSDLSVSNTETSSNVTSNSSVSNTATSSNVTSDSSVANTANSLNISGDSSVAKTAILSNITSDLSVAKTATASNVAGNESWRPNQQDFDSSAAANLSLDSLDISERSGNRTGRKSLASVDISHVSQSFSLSPSLHTLNPNDDSHLSSRYPYASSLSPIVIPESDEEEPVEYITAKHSDDEDNDEDDNSLIHIPNDDSEIIVIESAENSPQKRDSEPIFIYSAENSPQNPRQSEMAPKIKTENGGKPKVQSRIPSFMPVLPDSHPNSKKTYVKKEVRDNEIQRLETIKSDLDKLKEVIDSLNTVKLPDGGVKIKRQYENIQKELKKQAEIVSNMVVATGAPTAEDIAKDGFDLWHQIKTQSENVESKYQGKQGLNTHNVQMNSTLARLRAMHEELSTRPDENVQIEEPRVLTVPLLLHQNQALAWLTWREEKFPHGGILADDMGLGKTLTMIALIAKSKYDSDMNEEDDEMDNWFSREKKVLIRGGTLIICPASLISHWVGEIEKRCQRYYFKVLVHHGNKREGKASRLAKWDIVITTYNLVQKDLKSLLGRIAWRRVILDEAHVMRNAKTLTAKSLCELHAKYRWCLTGTPVHNKNLDLYSLLQFLRCSPFDDLAVWKKWIDNKSAGAQERLSLINKSLMLRRTKEQLKAAGTLTNLPDKNYKEVELKLSPEEMAVYQNVLVFSRTLFAQYLHQRAEKDANSHMLSKEEYFRMHRKLVALHGGQKIKSAEILVLILRLRQICCHPGLIASMLDPTDMEDAGFEESPEDQSLDLLAKLKQLNVNDDDNNDDQTQAELPGEGTTAKDAMRSVLSASNPVFNLEKKSSKIEAVIKCLYENVFTSKGDKAVIVSQWTSMLSIFEKHLKADGIKCVSITGKVPVPLRAEVVEKFNDPKSDVQVMLLSLCAGGVGLNLIGGNHLLLTDLHWNPQLEVQAQDRIYRVGQNKDVHVYRFRCIETIEQKIKKLQDDKLQQAESVMTGAKYVPSSKLSLEEMKDLFDMK